MHDDPPDILLTNYKMLDQLLLRPEEQPTIRRALPTLIPRASSGQPHR